MRTVTADEIVTAFEKTGLRPVQKAIGVDLCGCALAALYELSVTGGKRDSAYDWADDQFGTGGKWALIHGFDGESPKQLPETRFHLNYIAGREAAKRLGLPVEE